MTIGFDGKRAANNLTGLGNYSRSLILHLAQFFPQNQYFVYTQKIKNTDQINSFFAAKRVNCKRPLRKDLFWRTFGIKKQLISDRIDLFHGLSHEIPVNLRVEQIPAVVTIHDLIFLKFPQYYSTIDRFIYKMKCKHACAQADRIVAISECTKRDIVDFFATDPNKIQVLYQSCDDSFKIVVPEEKKQLVRQKFELPEKYLLNVGTIETRKNLLTLIQALPHIDETYQLVVVGKHTSYFKEVVREMEVLGLQDRVIFLKNVSFDELPAIYQMATVFVYPSLYEGFGIPLIEALHSAVPVVAATGSCLEEAGGPQSSYIAPKDYMGFADAINRLLQSSTEEINRLVAEGLTYVQRFDNQKLSNELMALYQHVLSTYPKN